MDADSLKMFECLTAAQKNLLTAQVLMSNRLERVEKALEVASTRLMSAAQMIAELAEAQKRTDAQIVELVDSQKHTDDKLDALADIVRLWIEGHRQ